MECELDTVAQVHVAQQSRRDKLRIQHPSPVMANHLYQQPRQRQMMIRNDGNDRNENRVEAVVAYEYDPTSDAAIFPNIPPPPPQEILNSNPLTVDQRWKFMASPHQIPFSPLNIYHHQQNQPPPSLMNFPQHQPPHHHRQLYQNAATITGNNQSCDDELVLLPSSSSSSSSYNATVAGLLDHNHLDLTTANISRSEGVHMRNGLLPHHNSSNHPQALSLSLSSNQWNCREMQGLREQFVDVSNGGLHNNHDRNSKPLMNMPFPPEIPRLEIEVQTASVHHNSNTRNNDNNNNMNNGNTMSNRNTTGPLGPFTGYATILKSSGFLKPAQDLLDEFCGLTTNHKPILPKASDDIGAYSGDQQYPAVEVGVNKTGSCLDIRAAGDHNGGGAPPLPMSSSTFGAKQICGEAAAVETGRISTDAWLPDYQQKKASLLHMQELVSRRYRQYKEQVQMVVSSFESVEGLSTAAPHVCVSLKLLTRHFKWLKNSISSQLRHIGNALPSPCVEGDGSMSWRSFHSQRLVEPQQHLWRPQRGLPERSVAVLRAWLFDHFLHPYPTDTDKQMLATRAGLSRNQVSNWFINARVRLWKPMVEEIHMLETKGGSGEAPNPGRVSKRARMEREGGGAAVSLTLGLRNTAESSRQVQSLHLGGHMIGEFVG